MVTYRYLGYGITNEQGIATLDHDAHGDPIDHSYTGTGAGEIDIVASTDDKDHISEGSLQSETYSIIDAIFKDYGTNTKWWSTGNNGSRSATNDEITFNYPSSSYNYFYPYLTDNFPSSWADKLNACTIFGGDFAVEFTIVSCTDYTNTGFRVENSNTNAQLMFNHLSLSNGDTLKIEFKNNLIYYYINGVKQSKETSYSYTDTRWAFRLQNNVSITIKEFKAYPI